MLSTLKRILRRGLRCLPATVLVCRVGGLSTANSGQLHPSVLPDLNSSSIVGFVNGGNVMWSASIFLSDKPPTAVTLRFTVRSDDGRFVRSVTLRGVTSGSVVFGGPAYSEGRTVCVSPKYTVPGLPRVRLTVVV